MTPQHRDDEAGRILRALAGWTVEGVGLEPWSGGGVLLSLTMTRPAAAVWTQDDGVIEVATPAKTVVLGATELGLWLEAEVGADDG